MKTLFSIAVLIAVIYLFLPKNVYEKLSSFMPRQQIEQAAESVLSDVDRRLEQFKNKQLVAQSHRITHLEAQLETLQEQVNEQAEQNRLTVIKINEQTLLAKQSTVENQKIESATISIHNTNPPKTLDSTNTHIEVDNMTTAVEKSAKEQAIKRQAYLQDLAERMNKTSLNALSK